MTKRADQNDREQLPARYREIVAELEARFGAVMHDLWNDDGLNVAPSRVGFVRKIRQKHPEDLTNQEINYIAFTSITTMGGVPTLKFVLPRFFLAYFLNRHEGWTVDPEALMDRLQLAKIEEWPREEQAAALQALQAFAQSEQELAVEDALSWGGDEADTFDPATAAVADWAARQLALLAGPPT